MNSTITIQDPDQILETIGEVDSMMATYEELVADTIVGLDEVEQCIQYAEDVISEAESAVSDAIEQISQKIKQKMQEKSDSDVSIDELKVDQMELHSMLDALNEKKNKLKQCKSMQEDMRMKLRTMSATVSDIANNGRVVNSKVSAYINKIKSAI